MLASLLSPADSAYERFRQLRLGDQIARRDSPDLTETDTRAKLIDPIFKTILEWREADISREDPADEGYADYRFGAEFAIFHVEAKRLTPRFDLRVPSRSRILKLDGPHLLGNKTIRPHLQQAARYSPDLGTDFAVVTNGDQFILFRTRASGKGWSRGSALVFHGLDDIDGHFVEFYNLLSRERVRGGALIEAFETADSITTTLHTPLEKIWNPDAELVRNPFWNQIAASVGTLLTDQPEDVVLQDEIIRNCYVRTPLSDQADQSINTRLQDRMPQFLTDAGTIDLQPGMQGKTAFDKSIENDVKGNIPATYLLTGGVGSGKTTFLKRFTRVVQPGFVKNYCVWLHIDFLPLGNVDPQTVDAELRAFAFRRMREELKTNYPAHWPISGDGVRTLFLDRIEDATKTRLYQVPKDSPNWIAGINELVASLYENDEVLVETLLRSLGQKGERVVLVLDNTDQLGEKFQESVFLLSQRLSKDCSALAIVALREEKFFAAYRRGIFDAYGDRRFHIGSPNLRDVIKRRLEYGLLRYSQLTGVTSTVETDKVQEVVNAFIRSATKSNQNIVRMLACVSNGDMRHAIGMFRDFVSSGNTDVDKIVQRIREYGGYIVPFHEFAKSAILGSRRHYKGTVSHTVNLFSRSAARASSHLTACRLLARLVSAQGVAARQGEGFVETPQILSEYRRTFGIAEDLVLRGDELLRRNLLESEPPRAQSLVDTDAIRVSASGAYYWRYLARSFAYLDLVFVDTPYTDPSVADRLADMSAQSDISIRFERVRLFLDYLEASEKTELNAATPDGPYNRALVPELRTQIEKEIGVIRRKTGARDLSEDELL